MARTITELFDDLDFATQRYECCIAELANAKLSIADAEKGLRLAQAAIDAAVQAKRDAAPAGSPWKPETKPLSEARFAV